MTKSNHFYVLAETRKGKGVVAYTVNDCVGGMESEHARYEIGLNYSASVALMLANQDRDDRNAKIV